MFGRRDFCEKRAGMHRNPFPDPTLPQQLLRSADDYFNITWWWQRYKFTLQQNTSDKAHRWLGISGRGLWCYFRRVCWCCFLWFFSYCITKMWWGRWAGWTSLCLTLTTAVTSVKLYNVSLQWAITFVTLHICHAPFCIPNLAVRRMFTHEPLVSCGSVVDHLAPVVQTFDGAIHRINHYPVGKCSGNNCVIHWIEIYSADSIIHLSNKWALN